jgi:predicted secreted acid phosphatase
MSRAVNNPAGMTTPAADSKESSPMSDKIPNIARLAIAMIAFVLYGCFATSPGSAQSPTGCFPVPEAVPANYSQPLNLDLIKKHLLYYRCSQYDADIAAVLSEAQKWIALRAPQVAKPALVLDIDETSLSNWTRIYKDDYAYFANGPCNLDKSSEACGDIEWQSTEQAPAIGPTRDLYNFARCNNVAQPCQAVEVFFITGRHESNQKVNGKTPTEWTLENLDKVGYKGLSPDHLYMRPALSSGPVSTFKTCSRADIEKRFGVTIIANIGDQASDLIGEHAERTFKVPNPFYFIP